MSRTVSVGELRQNPTRALNEVLDGATVVVTRHNRPIADLVPHVGPPGIAAADLMDRLRELGGPIEIDDEFLDDLAAWRAAPERDYWT